MKLPKGYSKRLVGPNLFFNSTGTVLDIPLVENQLQVITLLEKEIHRILILLKWNNIVIKHKVYNNGIRVAFTCPYDITLASCDVIDYAWQSVRLFLMTNKYENDRDILDTLSPIIKAEENLKLREVYTEAQARSLNMFYDNGVITIGSGKYAYQANLSSLDISSINWKLIRDIPIVLVTGTNGKTTTVRLTNALCQSAGLSVGYCSTDWVKINGDIIDKGDYSGPSGSKYVLTNRNIDVAVLEVARGGLCTRGLGNTNVTASTVSNISVDHLGMDGIETLQDLCEAKSIVYSAVETTGHAVINLDDKYILNRYESEKIKGKKIFFSQKLSDSEIAKYLNIASYVCFIKDGFFTLKTSTNETKIIRVNDVPITFKGYAKHNIENVLNAIILAIELGCSISDISRGLLEYQHTSNENLGRSNIFKLNGATVILDFAHNVAGLDAILNMSKVYNPKSLKLMWGQTGDRLFMVDQMAKVTAHHAPEVMVINEIANFLRGATIGEVPKFIDNSLKRYGYPESSIIHVDDEMSGVHYLLKDLREGDVCILCVHENIEGVIEVIKKYTESINQLI